jgi:peptidoglycan hydrolase-like protein with peptidoglycan-binding domain
MRTRRVVGSSVTLAIAVSSVGVAMSPAGANAFYPSGCAVSARNGWSPNCYLGTSGSYINSDAPYVYGVQTILNDLGYTIARDCVFGSTTASQVQAWQSNHGLSVDGVVGPNTWTSLQSALAYDHQGSGFAYYNVGFDASRFEKYVSSAFNGYWDVTAITNDYYKFMRGTTPCN